MIVPVTGRTDPGFELCLEAFSANFEGEDAERGAACAIYHDGTPVLDAWGGLADAETGRLWQRETAVPVFSVTKGVAALVVLMLVDRGLLDLDSPVARYWPEFGVHGKGAVTIREALAHRAWVPAIAGPISIDNLHDSAAMAARLAAEPPIHEPGRAHLYHALTVGWITSELVRRVTGQTLCRWLDQELCEPLGLNLCIGNAALRVRDIAVLETPPQNDSPPIDRDSIPARAITLNGLFEPRVSAIAAALSRAEFQEVELAGANCLSDARSLAKLYAAATGVIDGVAPLSTATLSDALRLMSHGSQYGQEFEGPSWGPGTMLPFAMQPMLGEGSFGHDGMGGALAFAHVPTRTTFAYVRNRMGVPGVLDAHVYRVVDALSQCLSITRSE
jgi:CubicO group peptidase (beta-lactamase class C family)